MSPMPVLVVISVLQFCISFPAVAGDCYDDPLNNNRSYDNCDSCFETLINALINTEDNKYLLGQTFFPPDAVQPVQVKVTYKSIDGGQVLAVSGSSDEGKVPPPFRTDATDNPDCNITKNCTTTWYWLLGEFYVFQPVDVFVYRSLYFTPPTWRTGSVNLHLPYQCFNNSGNFDKFFAYLTQRLNIHASYHTATSVADLRTYVGRAIKANHPPYDDDDLLGEYFNIGLHIVQAMYIVPFCVVFLILICVLSAYLSAYLPCCNNTKYKDTLNKYKDSFCNNIKMQGNLTAATLLCCIFTLYTFSLDVVSLWIENNADLPEYFKKRSYSIFWITVVFSFFSFLCDILGIILFFLVYCHNFYFYQFCRDHYNVHEGCFFSCCKKKWDVYIPMLFCIGSALLSLSFHSQNILIAWSTDPFYASRIALFYGILIFFFFLLFKYAYIIPLKITRRHENINNHDDRWSIPELIFLLLSLAITMVVSVGITLTVGLFIVHVPINNSIEQSITGITTIFNGAIILIGGLVAYSVGVRHFGNPFSFENALKKAMEEMNAPFNPAGNNPTWERLTEEGRMTEVMKALIHCQTLSRPRYSSLYSALISVLLRAQRNGKLINPPADQVVTLSTVLCDTIDTAVKIAAGNNAANIHTLTDRFIEVMSDPQFVLDGPLTLQPTEDMLQGLKNTLQHHINKDLTVNRILMELTIALYPPLPSALANVVRKAKNNGNLINPTPAQVFALTTALYDNIKPAAGNNENLTSALVTVMSTPLFVLNDPHIHLDVIPAEEVLIVLQNEIRGHMHIDQPANLIDSDSIIMELTIALSPPLRSALANVVRRARKNGNPINPPLTSAGVFVLTTALYNNITLAAGNNENLTYALVTVMSNPEFVLDGPYIHLTEIPTDEVLRVLRNNVQSHMHIGQQDPIDSSGIEMDLTIALFFPRLRSALANVVRKAQNNGNPINPPPNSDQVFALTTALYDNITPAVENDDIDNFIGILSSFEYTLNDPQRNIDLVKPVGERDLNDLGQTIKTALNQNTPEDRMQAVKDALIAALS